MSKSSVRYKTNILKRSRLALGVASAAALFSINSFASEESVRVDIDAQRTDKALLELAEETGVQIVFTPEMAQKTVSVSVQGDMSVASALNKLLEGTNLTYELSGSKTFVISEKDDEGSSDDVDEEIVVTGSAIRNSSPTGQLKVYTAEDIARLGVGSTEDFIRKLPQNFSGLNSFTSTSRFTLSDNGAERDAVGSAAADLGGLGNDATLILINGKRTAQSALFEGGVVNLANIPISAIARVEILLDGASARYGSDAVGGVINFITKKDYVGSESSLRYETGRNGSNTVRFNQLIGYNWGSGGITGTLSYQERKPVDNAKLGITSFDQTARGGSNWELVSSFSETGVGRAQFARTGAVFEASTNEQFCADLDVSIFPGACEVFGIDRFAVSRGDFLGFLPTDSDGTSWTASDLSPANLNTERFQPRDRGVLSETKSVNLSFNQDVTEGFNVYTELTYTINTSTNRDRVGGFFSVLVPEQNAFNSTGSDVFVDYVPLTETLNGQVPFGTIENESTRVDFHVGFTADLPFDGWQSRVDFGYSEDETESGGLGSAAGEPRAFLLETLTPDYTERHARFLELLSSTDPAQALNLFGNGSAQSPFLTDIYGTSFANNPASLSKSVEAQMDGGLFELPGGEVRMALGLEYRKDERDYSNDILRATDPVFGTGGFEFTQEPSRDSTAVYTEFDIPLIGQSNALPGVQSFQVSIGARWEEYGIDDAFAVSGVLGEDVTYERVGQSKFNNVSPRIGFNWQVVDDFSIKASWGESFRAPNFTELLGASTDRLSRSICVLDPNDPRPFDSRDTPDGRTCFVGFLSQANPELQPETANTLAVGFQWTPGYLEGLVVDASFRRVDFKDRIASATSSSNTIGNEVFFDLGDEFIVRYPQGHPRAGLVNYFISKSINFAERLSEVVDFTVSYDFSTDYGDFRAALDGVYTATLEDTFVAGSEPINRVGTNNGPEDWKGRLSLSWNRAGANVNMFVNYSGSYENEFFPPEGLPIGASGRPVQQVGSYTTIDLTANYDFGDGWKVEAGSNNVTNKLAPFYNSPEGFDSRVYNPTGRNVYVEVKKDFNL